jgi:hypothetical protein
MMDFSLEQNDLEINNGDINLCKSDIDATAQIITIRLKTLAGEWFLDSNIGIPYLTQVLGKKRNDRFLRRLIAKEIQSVSRIKELSDFSFDEGSAPRNVAIKFKASLSDRSIISINESIGV